MIENNYPFIYHSLGGEDNPDARLRRDSARHFFSPAHIAAFAIVSYPFTDTQQQALRQKVATIYNRHPKFDLQFDLNTDDKLYCTEFVYKAITTTLADTTYLPLTSVLGRTFVGTDNLFINDHAHLVWQVKY